MSKGILSKVDNLPSEKMVLSLINLPRIKLDLIEYSDPNGIHLLLRRIKFLAAENIKGVEIKIGMPEAMALANALHEYLSTKAQHLPARSVENRD